MKKCISVILAATMMLSLFCGFSITAGAAESFTLTLGEKYANTLKGQVLYSMMNDTHRYTFTMNESSNVGIAVAGDDSSKYWSLSSSDYSVSISSQSVPSAKSCYLPAGKSYTLSVTGKGEYALMVQKLDADKLTLKSKSGKISDGKKAVEFTYTGTYDYAKANLSVSSSQPKVATADFTLSSGSNSGTLTINPIRIGKAVISLKMAGSNTVKYTIYVTKGYWFVAKGKAKVPNPIGVKSPKWKSSNKKIVTINKKTGKIKAKKGGRVTITAKKGKVSYKYSTVVTDYIKLGKKAYREIKDVVNNPEKLKIYNVYKGYTKLVYNGIKLPVVVVDYGSTNENGAMVRNKVAAYYNDVYEIQYKYGWDTSNIISKKSMKAKSIK